MTYLEQNNQTGDKIYLYYNAQYAFRYYQKDYHLDEEDVIVGVAARANPILYAEDIEQLFGERRVWVVFSHVYDEGSVGNEREYFSMMMACHGKRVDSRRSKGAVLYLYNFSDEAAREAQEKHPNCP
jgi:hypothetical protein